MITGVLRSGEGAIVLEPFLWGCEQFRATKQLYIENLFVINLSLIFFKSVKKSKGIRSGFEE